MTSGLGSWESGRRRRRWSDEDKVRIVAECEAPGSSVSLVARRHDLNTNLLFSWRRRLRGGGARLGRSDSSRRLLHHKRWLGIGRQSYGGIHRLMF